MNPLYCHIFSLVNVYIFKQFEELITHAGLIYAAVQNGPVSQEMPTGTMFVDRSVLCYYCIQWLIFDDVMLQYS